MLLVFSSQRNMMCATPKPVQRQTQTSATPMRQSFLDSRLGLRRPCETHNCVDRSRYKFFFSGTRVKSYTVICMNNIVNFFFPFLLLYKMVV